MVRPTTSVVSNRWRATLAETTALDSPLSKSAFVYGLPHKNSKQKTCQNASSVSISSTLILPPPGREARILLLTEVMVTASGIVNILKHSRAVVTDIWLLAALLCCSLCRDVIALTYNDRERLTSGTQSFIRICNVSTITIIMQIAKAVPTIQTILISRFSFNW